MSEDKNIYANTMVHIKDIEKNEPYTLKKATYETVIVNLSNDQKLPSSRIKFAIDIVNKFRQSGAVTLDEISDWIAAIKSGKKIVNPMSPREEFRVKRHELSTKYLNIITDFVDPLVEIIAKEHPDVADWLSDDNIDQKSLDESDGEAKLSGIRSDEDDY